MLAPSEKYAPQGINQDCRPEGGSVYVCLNLKSSSLSCIRGSRSESGYGMLPVFFRRRIRGKGEAGATHSNGKGRARDTLNLHRLSPPVGRRQLISLKSLEKARTLGFT